ncbi:hypothetical protein ABPG72_019969 [Tetrahymena utriculariae]
MEIENPPQELSANISVEPQIRYACVLLKHLGNSASNIVQILKEFDDVEISERSVYRFSKQWKEEHRIKSQFHRKGNQIYSEDDKQMIVEEFQKDPTLSTYQAHISNQVNPKGMRPASIKWVEGSINSESYIQILDNFMQEHQNIINERSLFQQDNAKAHSSAKTLED